MSIQKDIEDDRLRLLETARREHKVVKKYARQWRRIERYNRLTAWVKLYKKHDVCFDKDAVDL